MSSVQAYQDICDYIVGPEECSDNIKVAKDGILSSEEKHCTLIEEDIESVCKVFQE